MSKKFARGLSGVATYDELLYEKKENASLFDKLSNEYIESLLNLEVSALSDNTLTEDEMNMLFENDFYKDLVYYNIYNKSKKLVDYSTYKYVFLDTWSNFDIRLNDVEEVKRIFQLNKLYDNTSLIQLFLAGRPMNFDTYYKENYIKKLLRLRSLCKINSLNNSYEYHALQQRLDRLNKITMDDMYEEYEKYKLYCNERNVFVAAFLTDCKLNICNDFYIDNKDNFVRKNKVYELKINR